MNAFVVVCACVLVVLAAIGLYDLQLRLERWDYNRHFYEYRPHRGWNHQCRVRRPSNSVRSANDHDTHPEGLGRAE